MVPVNELQREFTAFINSMDVRLGAFVLADLPETFEKEDGETVKFPKDFGPKSLPMLELFVLSKFPSTEAILEAENRRFFEGLIRYLGETYLRAIGGVWDHDETTGSGMPFIRPDTEEGPAAGEPIPLVGIVLTAVDQRSAEVFTAVLNKAESSSEGRTAAPQVHGTVPGHAHGRELERRRRSSTSPASSAPSNRASPRGRRSRPIPRRGASIVRAWPGWASRSRSATTPPRT